MKSSKHIMKYSIKTIVLVAVTAILASCNTDNNSRNYVFFPNMYEDVGYDTYLPIEFMNASAAGTPATNSVARGHMPYDYSNTIKGKEAARIQPVPFDDINSEENLKVGKELFNIYCAICHGTKGDGQGNLVKRDKILGVPTYSDPARNITIGTAYHTIFYGLNSMGSYKNQLNYKERWLVSNYVMKLKKDLTK
jgi:mono/diheme cytochrome c family protein